MVKRFLSEYSTVAILIAIVAVSLRFVPFFASLDNAQALLLSVTTIGLVACTMMFCLGTGDVDLSVGSVAALAGVMATVLLKHRGWSVESSILAALGAGAGVGLINGLVIAKLKVNALIATLATMQIVRGVAFLTAPGGTSVGVSDPGFISVGKWVQFGAPAPIWYAAFAFLLFGLLLSRTVFGRNMLATGGNQEAARLAGINVDAVRVWIFTLQGLVAAFAGVILAARVSSSQPKMGEGLELQVISACVLGGVSLTGGVASMTGVVAGVLIMGVVQNAMSLLNIDSYWQFVVFGSVLLVAVTLDRLKSRSAGS